MKISDCYGPAQPWTVFFLYAPFALELGLDLGAALLVVVEPRRHAVVRLRRLLLVAVGPRDRLWRR